MSEKNGQRKLSLSRLKIQAVMGIDSLEIEPGGSVIEIAGDNATGKTSVLEALKSALSGAKDAHLVRKGEEQGEIVLVLGDGRSIIKELRQDGGAHQGVEADGSTAKRKTDFFAEFMEGLGANPLNLLTASPKQRLNALLAALPIDLDQDRLKAVVPEDFHESLDDEAHPLVLLDSIRKEIYGSRTEVGREIKDLEGAVSSADEAMPDPPETPGIDTWSEAEEYFRDEAQSLNHSHQQSAAQIRSKAEQAKEKVDSELELKIEKLKREAQEKKAEIDLHAQEERQELDERGLPAIRKAEEAHAQAKVQAEAERRVRALKERTEQQRRTLQERQDRRGLLTQALEDIDKLKEELSSKVDIPGVSIVDGEIHVEDDRGEPIPWPMVNSARRIDLAVRIAELQSEGSRLLCLDGMEALGNEAWAELVERLKESDRICFLARRTDGPLQLRTLDNEEVSHA